MERCNRPAWRSYGGEADTRYALYRVCRDHAPMNDPTQTLHENSIGPCDYPIAEEEESERWAS